MLGLQACWFRRGGQKEPVILCLARILILKRGEAAGHGKDALGEGSKERLMRRQKLGTARAESSG